MHTRQLAAFVLVTSGFLLGCEQHPVETAPQSPPLGVAQTRPATNIPTPSSDPSLPPLSAVPAASNTGSDKNADSTLTPAERSTQMPLPGQANDHSNPEAAKRGDATAPVKPAN